MGFYSKYEGKSIGKMMHFLYHYCGVNVASQAMFDRGDRITLYGRDFASAVWNEEVITIGGIYPSIKIDIPTFTFTEEFKTYQSNQIYKKAEAIDDLDVVYNIKNGKT